MATSKIAGTTLMTDIREGEVFAKSESKTQRLPLLKALCMPIGVVSGLLISTFPLSAPVLYVIALVLFAK